MLEQLSRIFSLSLSRSSGQLASLTTLLICGNVAPDWLPGLALGLALSAIPFGIIVSIPFSYVGELRAGYQLSDAELNGRVAKLAVVTATISVAFLFAAAKLPWETWVPGEAIVTANATQFADTLKFSFPIVGATAVLAVTLEVISKNHLVAKLRLTQTCLQVSLSITTIALHKYNLISSISNLALAYVFSDIVALICFLAFGKVGLASRLKSLRTRTSGRLKNISSLAIAGTLIERYKAAAVTGMMASIGPSDLNAFATSNAIVMLAMIPLIGAGAGVTHDIASNRNAHIGSLARLPAVRAYWAAGAIAGLVCLLFFLIGESQSINNSALKMIAEQPEVYILLLISEIFMCFSLTLARGYGKNTIASVIYWAAVCAMLVTANHFAQSTIQLIGTYSTFSVIAAIIITTVTTIQHNNTICKNLLTK